MEFDLVTSVCERRQEQSELFGPVKGRDFKNIYFYVQARKNGVALRGYDEFTLTMVMVSAYRLCSACLIIESYLHGDYC